MSEEDVLKQQKKIIKINAITSCILFIAISFCFFINKPSYPLGLIFGLIVSSLNHWLLYVFSGRILLYGAEVKKKSLFYYFLRMFIFALGLTLCLLLDFFKIYYLSWITYLIPFITLYIAIILVMRK